MKSKNMKKLLAGMGIAGLISAGGISVPHDASAAGSGWSAKTDSVVDAAKKHAEECLNKAIETAATDQDAARSMAKECINDAIDTAIDKKAGSEKPKKKASSGWSG